MRIEFVCFWVSLILHTKPILLYNLDKFMESESNPVIRILIADPDTAFCIAARRALDQYGYQVTIAHDGSDLLARFAPENFEIVMAGVQLRRPSGLDILRHIKKRSPDTPVFLLCDEQSVDMAQTGVQEGAFAYFSTHMEDFEELADAVEHALDTPRLSEKEMPAVPSSAGEEVIYASTRGLATGLMRELILSTHSKPLNETLQFAALAGAQVLGTANGVAVQLSPGGLQITTSLGEATEDLRDFVARANEGFAYRVGSARKTLIDAMLSEKDKQPIQFIGTPMMLADEWLGALIAYPLPNDEIVDTARVTWLELFAQQCALAIAFDRLREENRHLSPQDPVSGILKRDTFMEMADREFRRSWRYNHALTAIIIDIDNMTVLNLKHGREYGNLILREVANTCRNIIRAGDLLGRYEEDSIALLLLMTGRDGARLVTDRLRIGINQIRLPGASNSTPITATLGVCSYPRPNCASIYDLLAITQEAQRTARRIGTNQIVYA